MKKEVEQKTSKLAIASFVLSIINLIGFFSWFGLLGIYYKYYITEIYVIYYLVIIPYVLSLSAIILGIVALVKIRRNISLKGKWMAIIGIILGILIPLIFILLIIWGTSVTPGYRSPMVAEPYEPCDNDMDGDCDWDDYELVTQAIGQCKDGDNYNTLADADHSGCVTERDREILFPTVPEK